MGEEREREQAGHLWKDWEREMAQVMLTRKRSKEYNWKKRHYDRARSRTRVNIGNAFQRWRNFKEQEGLKTDAEVALFLLNIKRFESCEDWRELDLGLALGGSLRLGEDAVPSPEDFSIHPKNGMFAKPKKSDK